MMKPYYYFLRIIIIRLLLKMKLFSKILTISLLSAQLCANSYSESCFEPWGTDAQLAYPTKKTKLPPPSLSQKICNNMIQFFQVYISPIDGPRSSFYPTSSQYARDAISHYGVLKGIAMGCDRLLRENKDLWVYEITSDYGIERKLDPVR